MSELRTIVEELNEMLSKHSRRFFLTAFIYSVNINFENILFTISDLRNSDDVVEVNIYSNQINRDVNDWDKEKIKNYALRQAKQNIKWHLEYFKSLDEQMDYLIGEYKK